MRRGWTHWFENGIPKDHGCSTNHLIEQTEMTEFASYEILTGMKQAVETTDRRCRMSALHLTRFGYCQMVK